MRILYAVAVALIFVSTSAQAVQSFYLHKTRMNARVMSMGGAFAAVADDYNALYFNPAGLARLKEGELNFALQGAAAMPDTLNFIKDLQGANTSDPAAMQNTLQRYYGTHISTRVTVEGTWARPGWAIGFIPVDATVEGDIRGTAGASVGVQAYQDTTIQFGKGWNYGENDSLSIGIAPKVVYRGYFEKDLTLFDLAVSKDLLRLSDAQEGLTFDGDIGAMYTFQHLENSFLKYSKPTVAMVIRNVADYGFKSNLHVLNKSSTSAPNLERRFDIGTRWDLPEFWVFTPRFMVDADDMGARNSSFRKSFRMGVELLWKAASWLKGGYRLGYHQGYISAGAGALLGIFQLDLATYSEEIGTTDAPRESRRWVAKLSLDF